MLSNVVFDHPNDQQVSLKPLCQVRWVVREKALSNVLASYGSILEALDQILEGSAGTVPSQTHATVLGIYSTLKCVTTYFAIKTCNVIFGLAEDFSIALQSVNMTFCGKRRASLFSLSPGSVRVSQCS
eukprot:Pompholyxophrys_sp_v1_NODE_362_length_669_cov_199.486971.p1 type:complete len:128 gc:universal NODE_362_length_669_cov_199.486971:220-603(+)